MIQHRITIDLYINGKPKGTTIKTLTLPHFLPIGYRIAVADGLATINDCRLSGDGKYVTVAAKMQVPDRFADIQTFLNLLAVNGFEIYEPSKPNPAAGISIENIGLSTKIVEWLKAEGIVTAQQVCLWTTEDLLCIRNFGESALKQLKEALARNGLHILSDEEHADDVERNPNS